ncbi:MAG TPA: hypothetical protein VES38_07690 [Methylotenera sp.]|nr:hypothetical protein [Methylotenera sp.]
MKFFIFLLFFAYTNLSLALGLGEIDLKSNLGEPLLAHVNVTDIDSPPDASCFSVSDVSDPSAFTKASILLKQTNGNYLLTITTKNVISEPIVNLRISLHCDPQINRDYLLLLDPVATATVESRAISDNQNMIVNPINNSAQNKHQASKSAPEIIENSTPVPPVKTIKKKKSNKRTSVAQSANQKLAEAYTGKQQLSVNSKSSPTSADKTVHQPAEKPASTDKPFLIISGGNSAANENAASPGLSLRLETQIDLARVEPATTPLSATEALDEVTMVTNRLAHLEKQLVSLQTRNTQLLAEVEKAKNAGPNWSKIILIALGILAALAAVEWLRRRILSLRASKEAAWFDAGAKTFTSEKDAISTNNSVNRFEVSSFADSSTDETSFNNLFTQNSGFSNTDSFAEHQKDDSGSVIDHADVFIEHDRPTLAIQLLQNHLSDLPKESPAVWLKLLKLLAINGTEAEYDDAVIECNKHYNIKVRSFAEAALDDISSIEDHPEIVTRLEGAWGSQYAVGFLKDLIYNKRSQPREGFEHNTFEELFFLKQIAEILQLSTQSNNSSTSYSSNADKPTLEKSIPKPKSLTDVDTLNDAEIFNAATSGERNRSSGNANSVNKQAKEFEAAKKIAATSLDSPPDPSYEVNMLFETDEVLNNPPTSTPSDVDSNLAPEIPILHIDEKFNADEIEFLIPAENIATDLTLDANFLNEEIILETEGNVEDVTFEQKLQLDNPEAKSKAKSKTTKQAAEKTASNLIEWDLPKLDLDKE